MHDFVYTEMESFKLKKLIPLFSYIPVDNYEQIQGIIKLIQVSEMKTITASGKYFINIPDKTG